MNINVSNVITSIIFYWGPCLWDPLALFSFLFFSFALPTPPVVYSHSAAPHLLKRLCKKAWVCSQTPSRFFGSFFFFTYSESTEDFSKFAVSYPKGDNIHERFRLGVNEKKHNLPIIASYCLEKHFPHRAGYFKHWTKDTNDALWTTSLSQACEMLDD